MPKTCEHVQYLPPLQVTMTTSGLKFSSQELANVFQRKVFSWHRQLSIINESASHLKLKVPFSKRTRSSCESERQKRERGHGKDGAIPHWGDIISRSLSHHPGTLQTPLSWEIGCAWVFARDKVIKTTNRGTGIFGGPQLLMAGCRIRGLKFEKHWLYGLLVCLHPVTVCLPRLSQVADFNLL